MHTTARKSWIKLYPFERFLIVCTFFLMIANCIQIFYFKADIDWWAYGRVATIVLLCFSLGQFYRSSGRSHTIGLTLISIGLLIGFSVMTVVFNYMLLPISAKPIDTTLLWFDQMLGFHWPDFVTWAAQYPLMSTILRFIYMSTTPQIVLFIIILGFSGRVRQLHVIMVSMVIAPFLGFIFWLFFPSFGPLTLFELPLDIQNQVKLFSDFSYGEELKILAYQGPGRISPENIKGLIAFPSFHIILACTVVYAIRNIKWAFPPLLIINLLMFPATILHGGHHVVDLLGGLIFFVLVIILSEKIIAAHYRSTGYDEIIKNTARPTQ